MMNDYYEQYIDYIKNTGGKPTVESFNRDWEPIGRLVLSDLVAKGCITITDGIIQLVGEG
jgi:hypothetical protein